MESGIRVIIWLPKGNLEEGVMLEVAAGAQVQALGDVLVRGGYLSVDGASRAKFYDEEVFIHPEVVLRDGDEFELKIGKPKKDGERNTFFAQIGLSD